jgi:hypothetical protein
MTKILTRLSLQLLQSTIYKKNIMTVDNEIERQTRKLRLSNADLQEEAIEVTDGTAPKTFHETESKEEPVRRCPYSFVPLKMGGNGGSHRPSTGSRALIENEVSYDDLKKMTESFYELAFQDFTLDKFIRSHSDPHGTRFAKFIHQKLTGSNVWDQDRRTRDLTPHPVAGGRTAVVHDRSSAHVAAWYSTKRPAKDVGRHFTLDECRVWMRLHFWALRKSGLSDISPSFTDYYVRFIGHFVSVYEGKAPKFARESFRWSANPKNLEAYIKNGRKMKDVLGLSFSKSLAQLPESESEDDEWPYNSTPQ